MKKRIFAALMAAWMIVSVLPMNIFAADSGTPAAQALPAVMENANQSDGVVLRKAAVPHTENGVLDGTVDIILEAYTTGVVYQTTTSVPTDIVLVLDVSGSMDTAAETETVYVTTYHAVNGTSWREWQGYSRVTYYGFESTSTTYYVNVGTDREPLYVSVRRVGADSANCYYYSYTDESDNTVYVYPRLNRNLNPDRANDYAVVPFYTQRVEAEEVVTATIMDELRTAVDSFITDTHEKNAQIAAEHPALTGAQLEALQHRIAIVKFAGNRYAGNNTPSVAEGNGFYTDGDGYEHNYSQVVKNLTTVNGAGRTVLLDAVRSLRPGGATAVDSGLTLAEMVLDPDNAGTAQRNKVVIVFSDGGPTYSNSFSTAVANNAIGVAGDIKFTGAKLYSISVAPDTDVTNTTTNINKFFHYMSSNYPSAADLNTPGANGNAAAGYYLVPSDTSSLAMIFQSIAQNIESPTIELGTSAEIVDTMSTFFSIPDGADSVTLYTSDRIKNDDGTWGWSDAIDNPDLTCHVQGKTVEVHGFNYDECYVSETPRTKGTNTAYYGTSLVIKINVVPDYAMIDDHADQIIDGNIPTNDNTANLLNSAGSKVATVNTPHIAAHTVTYQYTDPVTRQTVVYRNYYRLPGAALSRITQTPAIHGYTFGGWTTSDVTVAADGTYTMPEKNVVFTGTFTANTHDVTYIITGYNPGAAAPAGSTGVAFGTTVTVAPDLSYPGYTFTGWTSNYPAIGAEDATFSMPDHDVELIGYFTANSGVPYKTIHYTQNPDGTYSVKETVDGAGKTDENVSAAVRVYPGFTLDTSVMGATVIGVDGVVDTVSSGKITADGQFTMHQFHTRNKYTVTYAYEGSVPAGAPAVPQSAEYYHGDTVIIAPHTEQDAVPDQTFAGWHSLDNTTVTDDMTSFTMPMGDITLYGRFSAKTNVPFTIEHYLEIPTARGTYPTTPNAAGSDRGVAGTIVYAKDYVRAFAGYTYDAAVAGSVTEGTVSENPVLVLKLYYTVNTYNVTYKYEGTVPAGATDLASYQITDVPYNTTVKVGADATAPGYVFSGWRIETPVETAIVDGSFTMPAENVVLVGSFTAKHDTPYRIEYYWQNAEDDGYTLHEGQNLTGITDTTVTIPERNYEGFTLNPTAPGTKTEGVITADGQLVLKRYYDRLSYTVRYAYEDGVAAGAPPVPVDTNTYRHGATVYVKPDAVLADYNFFGWYSKVNGSVTSEDVSFKMPIPENGEYVILYGDFAAQTDVQFKIEHYLQSAADAGVYTLATTDTAYGVAGATVYDAAYVRTFTGYTYAPDTDNQGIIASGLVLKLYYTIHLHDVIYKYEGTVPAGATDLTSYQMTDVPYNTTVTVGKDAAAPGYIFSGWTLADPISTPVVDGQFTMPDADVTLVGSFEARANNKYTVEYYWQNTTGEGFTLYETDVYNNGVTDQTVYAPEKIYTGLTLDKSVPGTAASGKVTPDGKLVLKLYYVRNTYTVSYHYETDVAGAPALPETATYRFGQTVTVAPDAVLLNYAFNGWYTKDAAFVVTSGMASFEMPAANVDLYGEFRRIEGLTYKVEHYLMDPTAGAYPAATDIVDVFHDGVAGETAVGTPKNASVDARFAGYVYDPDADGSIPSGTVVVSSDPNYPLTLKMYYSLASYNVVYEYEGTLPANRSPLPATESREYQSTVQIAPNATAEGYTFSGWTIKEPAGVTVNGGTFTMPAATVILVGSFRRNPAYEVEYWLQTSDHSGYVKDEASSHSHTAPVGATVSAHVRVFKGYTENTTHPDRVPTGTVPAEGKLVLKLYYDLNDYTVTYVFEEPVPAGAELPAAETRHFGDTVTTPVPSLEGYTFSGWTSEQVGPVPAGQSFTMPEKNVVLKGKFIAGEASYKIEHYLMNDQGHYDGVVPHTETKAGVVGDSVRATSYQPYLDMGAKIDADKTYKDGKWEGIVVPSATDPLTLILYYSREPAARVEYHYEGDLTREQWRELGWPDLPTDDTRYYIGATVTAKDVVGTKPDKMVFEGWYSSDPTITVAPNGTFTMPRLEGNDPVIHLYGRWTSTAPQTFVVKYFVDGIEQTQFTQTYPLNTPVKVMANLQNTPSHSYTPWSTPVSATDGVEVIIDSEGIFTMQKPGEVHIRCISIPIMQEEQYNVRYYVDGRLYWEGGYALFERHFILDAPLLPPNVYFSGWSAPRTEHGNEVKVLNDKLGRLCFTMPADDVVLYGTTSTKPIPDGALQIRKEVSAPDGFNGKDTFTFHIYQVIGDTKTLVETVTVKVSSKTGRGESALIELPKGNTYLVEEAGAGVPGYALTTTVTDRNGDPLPAGATVVVGPRVTPTVLHFTNTYEELPLETRDHFGYIIGYPDETVRPEAHITRAEVATIFFRLLTDEKRAECWSQTNSFIDVAPNAWYNNAISTLVKAGALAGYEDNTFRPDQPITRAELVKIAMSFYGSLGDSADAFNDVGEHWAAAFINAAAEMGFVDGYGDNTFQPDRYVTRAEAMKIINRTLNRAPHKDHLLPDMITWADNADTSAWYYAEVQEATNSHMYYRDNTHEVWEKIRPIRDWAELEKQWSNAYSGKQ